MLEDRVHSAEVRADVVGAAWKDCQAHGPQRLQQVHAVRLGHAFREIIGAQQVRPPPQAILSMVSAAAARHIAVVQAMELQHQTSFGSQ